MIKKKVLIIGKQGVGKTELAETLAKKLNFPVIDHICELCEIEDKNGIYVSHSIPKTLAKSDLPFGFTLIHLQ